MIPGAQCDFCSEGFVVVYAQKYPSNLPHKSPQVPRCRISSFLPIFLSLCPAVLQRCVCAQRLKLQPAAFSQKRSVDRCDFFFSLSPLQIPRVLRSQDEGCRLTQECGPSQKCQPLCAILQLRNVAKYKLYHTHTRPI